MNALARLTFGALVLATVGAFFVTQRLKRSPPVIGQALFSPRAFSPNHDGIRDRARVVFRIKRDDSVTVGVVDGEGDVVRTLADARSVSGGVRVAIVWDGKEDDGRLAPDGRYRVRLGLLHAGRSVFLPGVVRLDLKPPHPRIVRVDGRRTDAARLPLIVRAGSRARIRVRFVSATPRSAALEVTRTDTEPARRVALVPIRRNVATAAWDGQVAGRPAPPGVYRLQVRTVDTAGNAGLSAKRAPGIGVTVRGVAVQPPLGAHRAGAPLVFLVDSRGRRYRWSVRGPGSGRALERGRGRGVTLRLRAPLGPSCACVLTVTAAGSRPDHASVPFAVTSARRHRILVVLPSLSWAGNDPADDDGNGVPNTLSRGGPAALRRPFPGLPVSWGSEEGRLLAHLDRRGDAYDLTTDAALALGSGPRLAGHRGVLLAGTEGWLPPAVATALRSFVSGGGTVASFSVRSLRRGVTLTGGASPQLVHPTALAGTDALRARFGPLVRRRSTLTVFTQGAGLFDTVSGVFPRWPAYEATRSVTPGRILAQAGPDPQTAVILAYRLGRGLVLRTGVPGWDLRLGRDPSVTDLTDRVWQLLSR